MNTHRLTLTCRECEHRWSLLRAESDATLEFENRVYLSRRAHIEKCEAAGVAVIDGQDPRKVISSTLEVLS